MKKLFIAFAVVATALLSSCVQEKSFYELTPVGENGIAFTMQNNETRSMVANPEASAQRGVSIPVNTGIQGEEFFLDETIQELNPSPETKGTPAYTVNVGTLYGTMGVYADSQNGNFGDDWLVFGVLDDTMYDNPNGGQGWRYSHNFPSSPWPENKKEKVDFYLYMPADYASVGSLTHTSDKSIGFDYSSPKEGANQKDILFGYTRLSKEEHHSYLPKGAPVMMYHALTGVKFRSGSTNGGATKTIITKVEFSGLKGTGHCEVAPDGTVTWSDRGNSPYNFIQTFDNPDYSPSLGSKNPDGTVAYISGENNKFGDSWYKPGVDTLNRFNTANLNDEDGSLTFWFVPQVLDSRVTLKVTFTVKTPDSPNGTPGENGSAVEITHTINFGEQLAGVEWTAGQLRTYTLNPKDVDVEIVDRMRGLVKDSLHVTNTGNVPEYVRMLVIGNWYGWDSQASKNRGDEPSILVGYKYKGDETASQIASGDNINTMQIPWTRWATQYGYFDSSFAGGELASGREDWVRATTAYYYTEPIGPGEKLSPLTDPIFKTYTLYGDSIPDIYLPSTDSDLRHLAVDVHLVMEVVVQAIGVPKNADGTNVGWQEAWSAATGIEIKPKN